jgi:hypothetical protein
MQTHHARSGFTLVELLIAGVAVVSLGATLLPAATTARQDATIQGCVQNMKWHSRGMSNFTLANDQMLPNAPSSPGGDREETYGPAGFPAFRFATTDRRHNGFAFGEQGIRTMGHPSGPPTFLTHTDRWMNSEQSLSHFYWIPIGEFMVEGSSVDAMTERFVSPADVQTRADWDLFIDWVKNDRAGALPALPEPIDGAAPIAGLEDRAPQGISSGSYLYPSSMYCTPEIWLRNPRTAAPVNARLYEKWGRFDGAGATVVSVEDYMQVVRKNRLSDCAHPSRKVAFFLDRAVHDEGLDWWFQPEARSTIALSDGSTRVVQPSIDAMGANQHENAGPALTLRYAGKDNPGQSPFTDEAEGAVELPFVATWGGIRGRDL